MQNNMILMSSVCIYNSKNPSQGFGSKGRNDNPDDEADKRDF